ncbi:MAG: hypothetical protein K2X69_05950, partial [Silvanigrellaceae bacterium]|nr:hypothetical protein [Silvanigrellaceae bacterium]
MNFLKNNLIPFFILSLIISILVANSYFLSTSAARIGEYLAEASILTVGIWFLTLFIPKKFGLYYLLSSVIFILLIPLAYVIFFTYQSYLLMHGQNSISNKEQLKYEIIQQINNLNKKLPSNMNEFIALKNIKIENNYAHYYYEIIKLDIEKIDKNEIIKNAKNSICQSKYLKTFIYAGMGIIFSYDIKNRNLTIIRFPDACK